MLLYGLEELPKPRALEAIAEPWRPWRSIASWYLWRAADTITPGR
jgi:DNA-3-methyladenine glycosylase II